MWVVAYVISSLHDAWARRMEAHDRPSPGALAGRTNAAPDRRSRLTPLTPLTKPQSRAIARTVVREPCSARKVGTAKVPTSLTAG
jgi:hypothetical protein